MIDWALIKREYTQSYGELISWAYGKDDVYTVSREELFLTKFQTRNLLDFFDWRGIFIETIYHYNGMRFSCNLYRILDTKSPYISTPILNSRRDAEDAIFIHAFSFLEGRLTP